jgi:hypothetical protein
MLSIEGTTYAEMFGNLASHPDLDDAERKAAVRIGEWFRRRDELVAAEREAQNAPDFDPLDESRPDPVGDHGRRAPFFGPTSPEVQSGQDWRTWICGDVRFRVYPYTAGPTMNVGIDRVDRTHSSH